MTERKPDSEPEEDVLLPSEIAAIEAKVQKEMDAEAKADAKKSLEAKVRNRIKQRRGIVEGEETVTIDLAPYADRVLIDNVSYLQGMTYTVRASVAAQLREVMQRTWNHQSEIDGKSENFYRKMRGAQVTPAGVINGVSSLLKA